MVSFSKAKEIHTLLGEFWVCPGVSSQLDVPKPPKDAKELPMDVWAPHTISEAEPTKIYSVYSSSLNYECYTIGNSCLWYRTQNYHDMFDWEISSAYFVLNSFLVYLWKLQGFKLKWHSRKRHPQQYKVPCHVKLIRIGLGIVTKGSRRQTDFQIPPRANRIGNLWDTTWWSMLFTSPVTPLNVVADCCISNDMSSFYLVRYQWTHYHLQWYSTQNVFWVWKTPHL